MRRYFFSRVALAPSGNRTVAASRAIPNVARCDGTRFFYSFFVTHLPLPSPSPLSLSLPSLRIVKNLTRPKSSVEHAVYKRFKAACTAVGAGELGDADYVDAIRSEFNALESDPWGEPQPRRKPSPPPSTVHDMDHRDRAFVATTPGAAGHAALLNLRHSFLWIKLTDLEETTDANAAPEGTLHPSAFPALSDAPIRKSDITDEDAVLLLEPDIKAHFVISRPTREYQRLLDALPEHFVGTHRRLVQLVDFLCEQMLVSFRERGMSVPPWRKNKSILSKWFLPTATSRSHPASPTGSPETRRRGALQKQDSGRRMSLDVVGGGRVVGVGEGYGEDPRDVKPMTPRMPMAVGAGA